MLLTTFFQINNLVSPFKALINIVDIRFKFTFLNKSEVFGWEGWEIYISPSLRLESTDVDSFNKR